MELRRIDKNSLLYKFCYGHRDNPPEETDTCSLRAAFLWSFIAWPIVLVFLVTLAPLLVIMLYVVGLPFAAGINWKSFSSNSEDLPMKMYKHWPRWHDYRIMPIVPLGVLGIILLVSWSIYDMFVSNPIASSVGLGIILGIIGLIVGWIYFAESENCRTLKQSIKDWKDQVCRPVTFYNSSETKDDPA